MPHDWPTKEEDLKIISAIISRYFFLHGGEPLSLAKLQYSPGEKVDIVLSDWLTEVLDYFSEHFSRARANEVLKRIISSYLIGGETVH